MKLNIKYMVMYLNIYFHVFLKYGNKFNENKLSYITLDVKGYYYY